MPEVELGDYTGIEIEAVKGEVTDEDVDAEIEKMADIASHGDTHTLGALKVLKKADIIAIYNMAK